MKKLVYYSSFVLLLAFLFQPNLNSLHAQIIYENCPNQELSFSIIDEETKQCGGQGRGGRGSSVTFLTCNPDPIQCCPGLQLPAEPLCNSLAP